MWGDWWAMWEARRYSREAWDAPAANLGRDRRVFRRIALKTPCTLKHQASGQEHQALMLDMSLGGAGVVAPASWPEGSRVCVRFSSLSWEKDGVLIFRRQGAGPGEGQWRYGLKFLSLTIRDLIRVRQILRGHYPGSLTVQ